MLSDGLQDAGGGRKITDNVIFVLKHGRAQWPNPELVSRGVPLSNSLLLGVPGSLMWEKVKKKSKTTPELRCDRPAIVLGGDINEGWGRYLTMLPNVLVRSPLLPLCSHLTAA